MTEPSLVAPPGATRSSERCAELEVPVPDGLGAQLAELTRASGVTLNTVLQTAWAMLLSGLLGRDDIVFGATVSGRPPELVGVESMVGLFINTVPVRVRLDPAATVAELLRRVQLEQSRTVDHQYLGLSEVQRAVGIGELFDTLTVFESYPVDRDALERAQRAGGVTITGVDGRDATNYPLVLTAGMSDRLVVKIDHRPSLIDADEAAALGDRLVAVLEALCARPDAPVADLDVLPSAERERVLAPGPPHPRHRRVAPSPTCSRTGSPPAPTAPQWCAVNSSRRSVSSVRPRRDWRGYSSIAACDPTTGSVSRFPGPAPWSTRSSPSSPPEAPTCPSTRPIPPTG